jgi:hypothetical protein
MRFRCAPNALYFLVKPVYILASNKGDIMAVITKSVLGNLSGKLGNIVIKKRNNKEVVYLLSGNHRTSKSAAAVRVRKNFAVTVKLAKSVNSVLMLKKIWTLSKAKGINSFQKLIKNNARLVKNGSLTASNKITPAGLSLKLNSASFANKNLHLSFVCPANQYLKFPAVLFAYLYFEGNGKSIVPVFAPLEAASPDGSYDIELILDSRTGRMFSKDPNPIIYVALAGGEHYKKKIYWTKTASLEM